jgi:chromosome segregation ATPase
MSRKWGYLFVAALMGMAIFFVGRGFNRPASSIGETALVPEDANRRLDEAERQAAKLNDEIVQLRKKLEDSSRRTEELEMKLAGATRALSSAEEKLRAADRGRSLPAAQRQQDRDMEGPRSRETNSSQFRRPADPGIYEVIRATEVLEQPSEFSPRVSTIAKGTRVTVVRSAGEWLEVRSKHGKPPGFLRRTDAMFVGEIR